MAWDAGARVELGKTRGENETKSAINEDDGRRGDEETSNINY
jgi:hypothetical protein